MLVPPSSATVAAHTELCPNVTVLGTSVSPLFVLHILSFSVLFNNDVCIVACYKIVDNHTVRSFVACGTFNLLCYLTVRIRLIVSSVGEAAYKSESLAGCFVRLPIDAEII